MEFQPGAMAGLGYMLTPNLTLDVGYRYLNLGDVKTGSGVFAAHEARIGVPMIRRPR